MSDEQKDNQSDLTPSNEPIKPKSTPERAPEISAEELPQGESKARQFFRNFFRWTAGLLVVFGLGVIAAIFLFYLPKVRELTSINDKLALANAEITNLEGQIETLNTRIEELSALEDTNQTLQDDLRMAGLHIHLLSALADVHAAQFALALGDIDNARLQLNNTPNALATLQETLEPDQQQAVDLMKQRLELAISELDNDPFAAQSDLEVLANSLIQLENSFR
ncbi:MAG: hypothetical protein ACE5GO_07190 [Anaerolineales bacterium]